MCIVFLLFLTSLPAFGASLKRGNVEIVYDPADAAVAQHSLLLVEKAFRDLAPELPKHDEPMRIVICRTYGEFRRQAGAYGVYGVDGVAIPEAGAVVVKGPSIQSPGSDYDSTLRHELIHLLLARNYRVAAMPRWLNEGIAMHLSGERRWNAWFGVAYMYLRGRIIPYDNLAVALDPAEDPREAGDAYAQSYEMTSYLMHRLGNPGFWGLVRALDTSSFPQALKARTGLSPEGLWKAWVGSLWKVALIFSLVSGFSAFQLMVVLTLLAYWRLRRHNQAVLRRWDEEEDEDEDIPYLFPHELEGQEAPFPWEEDDDEGRL